MNRTLTWTALALAGTLLWDLSGADLAVMAWLGDANGFALRHQVLLERVLHDAVRQVATLAYAGLWLIVLKPWGPLRDHSRRERLEVAVGVTLALLVINTIKRHSLTSCPWDLETFGGAARYVSHWAWGVPDGGPGVCFPGGHASSVLAFLPLVWPGLADPAGTPRHTRARHGLALILSLGALLGAVQTVRGAHYPSHTLWTAWLCWGTAWVNHALFGGFSAARRQSP